jgi:hypothetical protein
MEDIRRRENNVFGGDLRRLLACEHKRLLDAGGGLKCGATGNETALAPGDAMESP